MDFVSNFMSVLRFFFILSLKAFIVCSPGVMAQEINNVNIAKSNDWVDVLTEDTWLKSKSVVEEHPMSERYLLVDSQFNLTSLFEFYYHYVVELHSGEAVSENSNILISFDPKYETLNVHSINIFRGTEKINKLAKHNIKILQREEELENHIYDETLTASIILDDVRTGDILEYSYSIIGSNPALKGQFHYYAFCESSVPVCHRRIRIINPIDKYINFYPENMRGHIEEIKKDNISEFLFEKKNVPPLLVDSERPSWDEPWEKVVITSSHGWKEIIEWAMSFYEIPQSPISEVEAIAKSFQEQFPDVNDQISAAIRYVQDDIRYFGVEIGEGGYVPVPPKETIEKRFGDCKGKTLLFLHIMKCLGVKAYPVLVDTETGQNIKSDGPGVSAFNHVIAVIFLNDKKYWIDVTRNYQHGSIDTIFQPDYGYGLILSDEFDELTEMNTDYGNKHKTIYNDVYDLREGPGKTVKIEIETQSTGVIAEKMRDQINYDGKEKLAKKYQDYLSRYYSDLKAKHPIAIQDNKITNTITTVEQYETDSFWTFDDKKSKYTASFYGYAIDDVIVYPKIRERSNTFEFSYPEEVEHNIKILFPKEWHLKSEDYEVNCPFFKYKRSYKYDKTNNIFSISYFYKSLVRSIEPGDIKAFISHMEDMDKETSYEIYEYQRKNNKKGSQGESEGRGTREMAVVVILFVFIMYSVVEFRRDKSATTSVNSEVYVCSTLKFILFSVLTLNMYHCYWFYRNWKFIKNKEATDIYPMVRAIFPYFWMNALLRKFAEFSQEFGRGNCMNNPAKYNSIPLLYFIAGMIAIKEGVWILVSSVLATMCLMPWHLSLLSIFETKRNIVSANSQWKMRHVTVIFIVIMIHMNAFGFNVAFIEFVANLVWKIK